MSEWLSSKRQKIRSVSEDVGKETLMYYWCECRLVQPLWKIAWVFLKKLKTELSYDPTIPLLGIFLKKMKTLIRKYKCPPIFTATLFTIAKMWKEAN